MAIKNVHVIGLNEFQEEVMIHLSLGRRLSFPSKTGDLHVASKFMVREYEDARGKRVADEERIKGIETSLPGPSIHIHVEEGMQLSDLQDQESYTYEVASIFLGAKDQEELQDHYYRFLEELGLSFEREVDLKALQEEASDEYHERSLMAGRGSLSLMHSYG